MRLPLNTSPTRLARSASLAGLIVLAVACPAAAQGARIQFPSQLDGAQPNVGTTPQPTLRTAPSVLPPNAGAQPLAPNFDPYAQPPATYAPPAGAYGANPYAQPPAYGANPYGQPYGANPYAQPPAYGANPYAQPPAYGQPYGAPPGAYPDGLVIPRPKRLQQLAFDYAFLPGDGGDDLQINDFNLRATLAFFPLGGQTPLLITPGFGLHLWHGPTGLDLPNQVYDFTLDFNLKPKFGEHVAFDLGVTPGIFTDFDGAGSDAFRVQGRAVAIITPNNRFQIVGGIVYYDRLDVKLLPVAGVVWTPNQDTRFELVFPRPKLSQRLTNVGNTEWWWYVAGEYGGGTWEADVAGTRQRVDYGDIRLLLGLDWANFQGPRGMVEIGYAVDRELQFETLPTFELDSSLIFRAGIVY